MQLEQVPLFQLKWTNAKMEPDVGIAISGAVIAIWKLS
jgi:hypothetical protein